MPDTIVDVLYDPFVGKLVSAAIGVLVVIVFVRFLQRTIAQRIQTQTTRYSLQKTLSFLSYIAIIFVLAVVFSDRMDNLTVALGVAGAGIAFALQEVIASFAGWIAISFGSFYRIGDRVQLGGIKGDVIDIGILRTAIMEIGEWVKGDLYSGRIVRIANSFIFKEPVFNYSSDFPFVWDEIIVPIKYGSDYRLARTILEETAHEIIGDYIEEAQAYWEKMVKKFVIENASVAPMVTLIANDNWLEFTLRYVVNFKRRRGTKDLLFQTLLERIEATDGKVAFASATFHLVELPALNVNLKSDQ